ncbi:MAG: hypothetical protein ACLP1E_08775 [Acidimicrobiales bacterium]
MSGTINIGGLAQGMLSGSKIIGPLTILGSNAECPILALTLAAGDNTIAVPTGTVAVVIVPGAGVAGVKYRTVFADSGTYISPTNPTVIAFDAANTPTSFYLNVASPGTGITSEITFI